MLRSTIARLPLFNSTRCYSTRVCSFDKFKPIVQNPLANTILVDVREPSELADYAVPGAINVPYKTSPQSFSLPAPQFKTEFGVVKPEPTKHLVFFCQKGIRARNAEEVANANGYNDTEVYEGSMSEWLEKGGRDIK